MCASKVPSSLYPRMLCIHRLAEVQTCLSRVRNNLVSTAFSTIHVKIQSFSRMLKHKLVIAREIKKQKSPFYVLSKYCMVNAAMSAFFLHFQNFHCSSVAFPLLNLSIMNT